MSPIVMFVGALSMAALAGVFINRFRGGWPRQIDPVTGLEKRRPGGFRLLTLAVSALPYALAGAVLLWQEPFVVELTAAALVMVLSAVMISEGHGEQMDGGRSLEAREKPNHADKVVALIYRAMGKTVDYGNRTFELIGLGLTGLIIHLPLAVAFCYSGHWFLGALFLLGGLAKAPLYEVGHEVIGELPLGLSEGPDARGINTEAGEALWGAFTYGTAALMTVATL